MGRAGQIAAVHTLDVHSKGKADGIAGYAAQRSRSHVAEEGHPCSAKQPLVPQLRSGYASQSRGLATKAASFLQENLLGHSGASVQQRVLQPASSAELATDEEQPAQQSRNLIAGLGSWAKKRHAEDAPDQVTPCIISASRAVLVHEPYLGM